MNITDAAARQYAQAMGLSIEEAPGALARLLDGAAVMSPAESWQAATDWPDYGEHMHAVFSAVLAPAPRGLVERPVTKFEARGRRLGHPIRELFFRRER